MHMAHSVLDRLGSTVKRLTSRIESLEYENAVLLDHLENFGVLKKESLSAHVHRLRFEAQRRASPEAGRVGLADVARSQVLAAGIADFAGTQEVLALCQCAAEAPELSLPLCATAAKSSGDAAAGDPEVRQPPILEDDEGLAMVYIFGGNDDAKTLNTCERFNPVTSVWDPLPPMRQARSAAAAAVLLNRVYVCGGNHCGQTLNHVEAYDPARECWQNMCPLLRSRSAAGAAELFGLLYVCGGWSGKQALASVERYNPCTGTWECVAQMQHRREWPMVTVDAGNLYLCGGQDGSEDVKAVELYDPKKQVWEILQMSLQCRRNAAVTVVNGSLYLCGGHGHDGRHVLNAAERFDPTQGVWEALTPMQTHRRNAMAAMVAGRIYICGGRGSRGNHFQGGGHALRTVERFDPNTGTWEAVPPMTTRRYRAAVAALPM
mmetsp:Transcript_122758/g.358313  ORF Transcript_122758/g.358313 Transcript_122758/m.358313 type:complete len:434 (-) Transcript_122758:29-1330(-)